MIWHHCTYEIPLFPEFVPTYMYTFNVESIRRISKVSSILLTVSSIQYPVNRFRDVRSSYFGVPEVSHPSLAA